MSVRLIETRSERETEQAGEQLAGQLQAGDVVLLEGELGAGKTAFVRGLARGLSIDPSEVTSPTFTLIQEYAGPRGTLQHVDLYRLSPLEVDDLGLEDLVGSNAIVAVEWPDRWRRPPADAHEVRIEHRGNDRRAITVARPGARSA